MCDQPEPFNPYKNFIGEMGSVVAIAGETYVVIASDSRLSRYFSILTRDQTKLFPMGESYVLGSVGPWADVLALKGVVSSQMLAYETKCEKKMPLNSLAHVIQMTQYETYYHTYSILAGLDDQGKGCVYGYCPKGTMNQTSHLAVGSAHSIIMPFLDSQVSAEMNIANLAVHPTLRTSLNKYTSLSMIQDVFNAAAELDIFTGDSLRISCITKNGIEQEKFLLRAD